MKKYEVVVAGTVIGTYNDKTEAEKRLNELRNSIFGMVHPRECMYIKERA